VRWRSRHVFDPRCKSCVSCGIARIHRERIGHRLDILGMATKSERERVKFERERYCVAQLTDLLRLPVERYRNPLDDYARETGVDVIAVVGKRRIGFQVTEYDGGEGNSRIKPGYIRAAEMKLVRETRETGVYTGWGSPFVEQAFPARIIAKVRKSLNYNFAGYDEVWLLVSANIPGAGLSTFVSHRYMTSDHLNQWTAATLASSRYARAFFISSWAMHSLSGITFPLGEN
jgi:hypothetical protein